MKKVLFIFLITISSAAYSQEDSLQWKFKLNECKASLGYVFQKEHLFEFGFKFDYYNQEKKFRIRQGFSLIAGGQLARHNKISYLAPFASIRYLHPFGDNVGGVIMTSYCHRRELEINSNIITPEIGINFNQFTISYGYNFFIDNPNPWISAHRIALRLMYQ